MDDAPKVYKAIAAVMADLSVDGIAKDRKNQQQNYQFRGIDDVYNALSPVLARHGLCMLPRILRRDVVERQTAGSPPKPLFYVTVEAEFDLVCSEDGSKHTIRTYGEAMDMADKATNKAMSAAYKYAAMQAFAIPTEGEDNDADATTHDVAASPKPSKDASRDLYAKIEAMLRGAGSMAELKDAWEGIDWSIIPKDWVKHLEAEKNARRDVLKAPKSTPAIPPNMEDDGFPGDLPAATVNALRYGNTP